MRRPDPRSDVEDFRIRVRRPLLLTLRVMHRLAHADTSLEIFLSEILEGAIAEWRQLKMDEETREQLLKGPPVAPVRAGSRFLDKISSSDRDKIRALRREGIPATEIAHRFHIAAYSVNRILQEQ